MHSIFCDIPEEKIKACVIFVALRGGINTGKFEKKIEFADRDTFGTFEGHLKGVLEWKKDPAKFIKELVEKPDQDELHKIIKEKLEKSK
jgi:DNA helicase-2/ATP-dependent DNA helicase PcrA